MKDSVYRCILLTHIHWAFWAMIMIPYDHVDSAEGVDECLKFYLEYAHLRLYLYKEVHEVLFPDGRFKLNSI